MNFEPVLIADRMAPMKAAGLWRDETIDVHFQRALANCPDKPAVVGYRDGQAEPVRLSYRELDRRVDLIARNPVHAAVEFAVAEPLRLGVPVTVGDDRDLVRAVAQRAPEMHVDRLVTP